MARKHLLVVVAILSVLVPLVASAQVGILPNNPVLSPGQQQQFGLVGYGSDVIWSIRPGSVGSISSTGVYTAPPSGGSAVIYAQPTGGGAPLYVTSVYTQPAITSGSSLTTANPIIPASPITPATPIVALNSSGSQQSSNTSLTPNSSSQISAVSISINPSSAYVQAGQTVLFSANVQGTTNHQVQWSLTPNIGTLNNGQYTAPASLSGDLQVTISATSMADVTKTATATALLGPVVWLLPQQPSPTTSTTIATNTSVTVSPGTQTVTAGQSVQFTASVQGNSNTAVTWSVYPSVGQIVNGVYTAPSNLSAQEAITVTATSVAAPSASATASLTVKPVANPVSAPQTVSISVFPSSAAVTGGQSTQFSALVSGTNNSTVTWSLNPQVGTVSNGKYTAPASVSSAQTVTITAVSAADSTKTASATVSLTPNVAPTSTSNNGTNNSAATTVTLPLEVIGPNGTTVSATVSVPAGANLGGQLLLWMQIHGLRFETQASVQVNNSAWMAISDSTVTLLGNATAYGGIGGGFSTLKMTLNLPAGLINTGSNTITFRFNQTDGRVSGFRVLAFNIEAADGTLLIPATTFVNDDPNNWQPPSTSASDISAGQTLWRTASLTTPLTSGGSKPILAHCSDCHAQDGRDLKYFNYSNNSIETRALFHGLTVQQGQQIASYIRSLNVPNPGRPWNPPYQPGPGLDSQPLADWAAGAGLDAVLDNDQQMLSAIFPSGFVPSVFAPTSRLNQRETPIPVQLPDWNQWLPGTHPIDAFGSTFTNSGYYTIYQALSSSLQPQNPSAYVAQKLQIDNWFGAFYNLYTQVVGPPIWAAGWNPTSTDALYSLPLWGMVKLWEMMQENQLEGYTQNIFGPQADPRGWYSNLPFFVAPHELKMNSAGTPGLRNGSAADYSYLTYAWYNVQLILNDSNGKQSYQFPLDWPYVYGFIKNMGGLSSPQGGIQTMWMLKALEVNQELGVGPQAAGNGWQPATAQPSWLVTTEWNTEVWTGVDATTRAAIANGIVQAWLSEVTQFTPQQFYTGGFTTQNATPVPGGNAYDAVFVDWVWYMIPRFGFIGVDPSLVNQLAQWAQTVWPNANWTADANATCNWLNNVPNGYIACSE